MNKRIIALMLAASMLLCLLCGCSSDDTKKGDTGEEKLSIVATIFPPYDFARAVAGENAELTMLISPGGEVHSYEPSASDLLKIKNCDIFIYTGGENDEWVEETLASMDVSGMKIIAMIDCVEAVEEELGAGMESESHDHDHEDGDESEHEDGDESEHEEAPELDEHVWTSPINAIRIVEEISAAISEADPDNADIYAASTASYIESIREIDSDFREVVANATRKTVLFADRFPFRYFVDEYGLEYYAAFSGCSTQGTASLATVKTLSDTVTQLGLPSVFYIEFSSEEMADTICEATGCKKLLLHSCHNVSAKDFEEGVTYCELMARNVVALEEALA